MLNPYILDIYHYFSVGHRPFLQVPRTMETQLISIDIGGITYQLTPHEMKVLETPELTLSQWIQEVRLYESENDSAIYRYNSTYKKYWEIRQKNEESKKG